MNAIIISVDQLQNQLGDDDLIILDASQSNEEGGQIKGARVFDIKNDFSDADSSFPNTFPTADQFQENARKLGINDNSKIVVYDNKGIFSSPRVWWMFKTFGHENVSVLDGGLPEWIKQGFETESTGDKKYKKGNFEVDLKPGQVKFINDMQKNFITMECEVVDARSEDRFKGAPESRPGLRSGHIPDSKNLPFQDLLEDGKFKSVEELRVRFNQLQLEDKPLIFTCGSGITACILLMGYQLAFEKNGAIYDGSWTEWGTLV